MNTVAKAAPSTLLQEAEQFLQLYAKEQELPQTAYRNRREEIIASVAAQGTYELTEAELTFGARVAWRNSIRCIGRLYWKSLHVFDARQVTDAETAFRLLCDHLLFATNEGNIRSAITIFPPDLEGRTPLKILNHQLIRYAGYAQPNGSVLGDPASASFTRFCESLGWQGKGTAFDILPLVVQEAGRPLVWFDWPEDICLEVPIAHPHQPGITGLGLKWYAVPVISDMWLSIGGLRFSAAPFNGWYMGAEIGARNLADKQRYNALPKVAEAMGLDTSRNATLWKDRALVELNAAVLHSYAQAGAKVVDHHSAAEQHAHFERIEQSHGRPVNGDWTWLIPPIFPSTTSTFHRTYDATELKPNFFYKTAAEKGCPMKG